MIQHDVTSTSPLCGKLHTQAELDNYEQTWHSHIFLPQWNALKMNVCTCNVDIFVRVHVQCKCLIIALCTKRPAMPPAKESSLSESLW